MKKRYFLSVLFFCASVYACVDMRDQLSSGVFFNNNECFFLDRFDSLGKEGTNFFKDCIMIKPDKSIKDVQILTSVKDPVDWHDDLSIKSMNITNNIMEITVKYGGGCTTHEFILYADSGLQKDNPSVLNFTLLHNANGDACKSLITETLVFNLRPIEKLYYSSAPLKIQINNTKPGILWYPDNTCSIKYRSHFDSDVMVIFEYSSVENFPSQVFPSLRIVTNPEVKYANGFNYKDALISELQWLRKCNIISAISDQTISHIKNSIGIRGQFWTLQDTLLTYNEFVSLTKDSSGELKWGDVLSINKRNCGSTLEFKLPTDTLNNSSTSVKFKSGITVGNNFVFRVAKNMITINLNQKTVSPFQIDIIDLSGRSLCKTMVPANKKSFVIQTPGGLSRGMYQVIFRTKGITQTRALIVSE